MSLRLAINALDDELEACTATCHRMGLGIEVTAFAWPAALGAGMEARIERCAGMVAGLPWKSLHGPFLDLYATSSDPAIVAVCRQRHHMGLRAAREIGATTYVAHLNSIPLIRNQSYRKRFVRTAAEFWLPFADEAGTHGITIVLENMWEPGPELQKGVVERAKHPHLKASFDNGHALVFSQSPASHWIEVLQADLAHCHLHDNDGEYDHHWPIGTGHEDWGVLFSALDRHAPQAVVVLESDRLEANEASLGALPRYVEGAS